MLNDGQRREFAELGYLVVPGVVPPEQVAEARAGIASLMARGKTPLSASLRHAAAVLPPGGSSIILVSDGLDTCDADPCAEAAALTTANTERAFRLPPACS